MDNIAEWAPTIVAIAAFAGLLWRFESRISGVETRLGERIARIEGLIEGLTDRVSRIENVLDTYFMQAAKSTREEQQ